MPGYLIADYLKTIAFPAMYAVTALLFLHTIGQQGIVLNHTMFTILNINAKKSIIQYIILNRHIFTVVNFYSAYIINTRNSASLLL